MTWGSLNDSDILDEIMSRTKELWPSDKRGPAGYTILAQERGLLRYTREQIVGEISRHYGSNPDNARPSWDSILFSLGRSYPGLQDPLNAHIRRCKALWVRLSAQDSYAHYREATSWAPEEVWDEWVRICGFTARNRKGADAQCDRHYPDKPADLTWGDWRGKISAREIARVPCGLTVGLCDANAITRGEVNRMHRLLKDAEQKAPFWLRMQGAGQQEFIEADVTPEPVTEDPGPRERLF